MIINSSDPNSKYPIYGGYHFYQPTGWSLFVLRQKNNQSFVAGKDLNFEDKYFVGYVEISNHSANKSFTFNKQPPFGTIVY
jgi:hypothetical protein